MKILFDPNTPANLKQHLSGHSVVAARQAGWEEIKNRELLNLAEQAGFDVFLTCDQNLAYQHDLSERIAIVELTKNNRPVKPHVVEIAAAVAAFKPGSYIRVVCGT